MIFLFTQGCAQYDSSVGSGIIGDGFKGTVKETIVPVLRDTTRVLGDSFKLQSVSVPLGIQDGLTSQMVVRYIDFAGLGDTLLSVSDARIEFFGNGFLDSAAVTDFTPWRAEINRIDSWYNPNDIRFDSDLDLTPLDTVEMGTSESLDSMFVVLDQETIFRWVNDTLRYGLLIRPLEESTFIKKFFVRPSNPLHAPLLQVTGTFEKNGTVYPDSLVKIQQSNSSFLTDDQTFDDDTRLFVSTGFVRNTLYYGDFSQFSPRTVSINRVQLILTVDTTWQHQFGERGEYTWNYLTSDWFDSPLDSIKVGSALSSSAYRAYAIADTIDSMRVDVTPISRTWVSLSEENFGVMVRSTNEGNIMRRAAIFSTKAADPAVRPYFKVTYTEYDEP